MNEQVQQLLQFVQSEEPGEPFNVYTGDGIPDGEPWSGTALFRETPRTSAIPANLPVAQHADLGDRAKPLCIMILAWWLMNRTSKTFDELQRAYRAFQDDEE
jgi:hypothetical protein